MAPQNEAIFLQTIVLQLLTQSARWTLWYNLLHTTWGRPHCRFCLHIIFQWFSGFDCDGEMGYGSGNWLFQYVLQIAFRTCFHVFRIRACIGCFFHATEYPYSSNLWTRLFFFHETGIFYFKHKEKEELRKPRSMWLHGFKPRGRLEN